MRSRAFLIVLLFLTWSFSSGWYYVCKVKAKCPSSLGAATKELPAFTFRYGISNPEVNPSFNEFKTRIKERLGESNLLTITGLYDPNELNTTDFDMLAENNQLTVRYVDPATENGEGITDELLPFPLSPNGSMRNIAGVCDATGLVFGLMPHPEAIYAKWLHPDHTRNTAPGPESSDALGDWEGEGLQIFRNAVDYAKANL